MKLIFSRNWKTISKHQKLFNSSAGGGPQNEQNFRMIFDCKTLWILPLNIITIYCFVNAENCLTQIMYIQTNLYSNDTANYDM